MHHLLPSGRWSLLSPFLVILMFGQLHPSVAGALGSESVESFGNAVQFVAPGSGTASPAIDIAASPSGGGYWLVAADGDVFAFGNANYDGSLSGMKLNEPVVGIAATPSGGGYWLVAGDGGVFAFGDAGFYGSLGSMTINKPVVGIAATPDSNGYWLVAADGGVFAFGDATTYGSLSGMNLNEPVVGIAATPSGGGYWLVTADGGVFAFGNAHYEGALSGQTLDAPVVGMAATPSGGGYWLVAADGGVFAFGNANYEGSALGDFGDAAVLGIAATPSGGGYWILGSVSPPVPVAAATAAAPVPTAAASSSGLPFTGPTGPAGTPPATVSTAAPAPPTAAQEAQLLQYACFATTDKTLQRELEYNSPKHMTVDVTKDVEAELSTVGTKLPSIAASGPKVVVPSLPTTCDVEAYLKGPGFNIVLDNPGEPQQSFVSSPTLDWVWSVTPEQAGNLQLTLTIQSTWTGHGPEQIGVVKSSNFEIDVFAIPKSPVKQTWSFLNSPFIVAIFIPLIAAAYHFVRKHRKNVAKKGVVPEPTSTD